MQSAAPDVSIGHGSRTASRVRSPARGALRAALAPSAFVLFAVLISSCCGGGGGGGGGGQKFVNFGVAVVGDDGSGFDNGIQAMKIEDSSGNALAMPEQLFTPLNASDIDGMSITPDGTHGAAVDGGNLVYFFTADLTNGTFDVSSQTVNVSNFGGDGDSIASLPDGDEVVVSAGAFSTNQHALISGVLSGTPTVAEAIPTSGGGNEFDGVVISKDGKVMLSRAGSADLLDVYSIAAVTPHPGSMGGTVAYDFTLTKTLSSPDVPSVYSYDGREGMAISPTDSSRAILIGEDVNGFPVAYLLTGLPDNPTVSQTISLSDLSVNSLNAVTITPDGKYAVIGASGTQGGLIVLSGVDTGTLAVVTQAVSMGPNFSPTFTTPAGSCNLNSPETLGVMADGKYVVAIQDCGLSQSSTDVGSGVLLTIPIANGMLSDPVGQLNYVVTPSNDQLLTH